MFFAYSLLNALISWVCADSLLDDAPLQIGHNTPRHTVILYNGTESERFRYSLLKESQTLSAQITEAEAKQMERVLQNEMDNNGYVNSESPDGMEFTDSHLIEKMKMPDFFDITLFKAVTDLRNAFGQEIDGKYVNNIESLYKMLSFYDYLDYSTKIQAKVNDYFTNKKTSISVDRNTVFAVNIAFHLAIAGELNYYKELLAEYDKYGINPAEGNSLVIGIFGPGTKHSKLSKDLARLFNKMPVLKAVIVLCKLNSEKKVVIKQKFFQIKHFNADGNRLSGALIKESPNSDKIMLTKLLGFCKKPHFLRIQLPAYNINEYFDFIRHYLCLFDTISKIYIIFYDSKTINNYNFGKDIDCRTQEFLSRIVNDLLPKSVVPHRPRISSLEIIGYEIINNSILEALATIPLTSLALLGADSKLDFLYILKLFEPSCALKDSIQEFGGTCGAAGILFSLIGGKQLKKLRICTVMQIKKTNYDIVMRDPCYDRLFTFFEDGNLASLPKVCRVQPGNKDPAMKFEVKYIRILSPQEKWFSPAGCNTSSESKKLIEKEIKLNEIAVWKMVTYSTDADLELIDTKDDNEMVITIRKPIQAEISDLLEKVGNIKGKKHLIIKYTRPQECRGTWYVCREAKELTYVLITVFRTWIVDDKSNENILTFEVAEKDGSISSYKCIFFYLYKHKYGEDAFEKLLERVVFKKYSEK
ncbi:hypothetical protein ENBRE01_1265 [Enteropsectra breve]|nr:hypothetical protein ENBRE01_1265 [Enteropsectra breve]